MNRNQPAGASPRFNNGADTNNRMLARAANSVFNGKNYQANK
jgi:hypothetical protein